MERTGPLGARTVSAESELLAEWTGYAYAIAEEFFLAGGDRDDIRQESLIGLLNAIRGYDPARAYLADVWNGDATAALRATHPDVGGDPDDFRKVQRARELLRGAS